jgi:DNA-binding transcriptional LysR family regulator
MNRDPDWSLYRSMLAVYDTGSLSAAARALGLTQPTLARHVAALEADLGCDLFQRSQLGLRPTEAATALAPYARRMAATAAALVRAASEAATEVAGAVRITASEMVGIEVLPPILVALRARHPRLAVELVLSDTVEDLLRGDADVAVRMVAPTQDALVVRALGAVALGLYGRRDYLAARGVPARLADLAGHDLVGYDRETPALRAMLARAPLVRRDDFALRADSNLAQLAAVRAGFGLGVVQVPIAARDPMLVRVLPDMVDLPLPVYVAMHEDLRTSARCRAAFDVLAAGLAAYLASGAAATPGARHEKAPPDGVREGR